MLPLAVQLPSGCCSSIKPSITFPCPSTKLKPYNNNNLIFGRRPNPSSFQFSDLKFNSGVVRRNTCLSASSAAAVEPLAEETPSDEDSTEPVKEKLGVVVKPMQKPRLILKFIWMEKNIGLALDQVIPGHGSIPLSPYYFWPRKDAWEELKVLLETKPWISQKQMVILLNQATDLINLWQQSGGDL